MRWLRITRFYRASSDFDRLSDTRCETLVVQARLQRGDAVWLVPGGLAMLVGAVTAGFSHLFVSLVLAVTTGSSAAGGPAGGVSNAAATTASALSTVLELMNLTTALAVMIVTFVVVRRSMLLRTMRRIINKAVCPWCDFSLVGLIPKHGRVTCPECGQSIVLAEHRLTEDDLIPETPEGLRAMREHWKAQGADRYGSLTDGSKLNTGKKLGGATSSGSATSRSNGSGTR